MYHQKIHRRGVLSVLAALGSAVLPRSASAEEADEVFQFEITRTEAEWRARLTGEEFGILRGGATEAPKSSPYWSETADGIYCCKGCNLTLYDAYWKVVLEIGWVFFRHSEPHATVTAIDRPDPEALLEGLTSGTMVPALSQEEIRELDELAGVEAKCRRCGSHLGHIVDLEGGVMHCINGSALVFQPAEI